MMHSPRILHTRMNTMMLFAFNVRQKLLAKQAWGEGLFGYCEGCQRLYCSRPGLAVGS